MALIRSSIELRINVVSSQYWSILACGVITPLILKSKPLIFSLSLILIAIISTIIRNNRGLAQQPCFTPLVVGKKLDNQPPFWTQLSETYNIVLTHCIKYSPKPKIVIAAIILSLLMLSKAFS